MIVFRRKLPPILVLVVLAFIFWFAKNWNSNPVTLAKLDSRIADTILVSNPDTPVFEVKPRQLDPAETQYISSRSIFSPSRRPFENEPIQAVEKPITDTEVAAPETLKPQVPPPNIRFSGIVESGGEVRALIEDLGSGQQKWFSLGDKIGDWNITVINNQRVVLRLGQREHFVQMIR